MSTPTTKTYIARLVLPADQAWTPAQARSFNETCVIGGVDSKGYGKRVATLKSKGAGFWNKLETIKRQLDEDGIDYQVATTDEEFYDIVAPNRGKLITPHKGGRDKWLSARVTEQERDRIKAVLEKVGLSLADWIMQRVEEAEKQVADEK